MQMYSSRYFGYNYFLATRIFNLFILLVKKYLFWKIFSTDLIFLDSGHEFLATDAEKSYTNFGHKKRMPQIAVYHPRLHLGIIYGEFEPFFIFLAECRNILGLSQDLKSILKYVKFEDNF